MNTRYALKRDLDNIKDIWNYCFNDGESYVDYYFNNKYKKENTVVIEDEENIISSLQLNQYKLRLNKKEYDSSYVVGVSTFPEARGMGCMKEIMNFSLSEMYKKGQLVSILMPIDYRLYRKYGYEHCYDQIEYNINIENLKNFRTSGKMVKATSSNVEDLIDINKYFTKNLNGNVIRDKEYYLNLFKEVKSENGNIYINYNDTNQGYIIYFIDGDNMFVREIYYKNIESLKSMLKFVYNHNTQCKKVTISAPMNDKIRMILDNPRVDEIKIKPFMMGRVINLKGYLESLDIESDLNEFINIEIEDNNIEENNGVFKLTIKDRQLSLERTNKESNIKLSVNTITQLCFSYIDVDEALFINNIKANEKIINMLNEIFTKKENYINEYV